jgi:transposase InsO family protein
VVQIYRANPGMHRFFGQHPNRLPIGGARQQNQIWLGDITYLAVGRGWRFLAVILDQYSRRVLAWKLAGRRDARLTRRVLDAAVRRRRPRRGLIFHSDRGSEYSAGRFVIASARSACKAPRGAGRRTTHRWRRSSIRSSRADPRHQGDN